MASKYAQPDRRPAVVTGASSGIGAATALRPGRGRLPGRARRAPYRQARGGRRPDPRPTAARRSRTRSTSPTTTRSTAFAKAVTADLGDIEVRGLQRRRGRARARSHEVDPERFARELDLNLRRRAPAGPRVRARHGRAAPRRRRLRLLRHRGPRRGRSWRRTPRASGGSRAWSHALQMELEGTGVRASRRPARPDLERDGHRLGRRGGGVRAQPVGAVRPGPAPALPEAAPRSPTRSPPSSARRAACT